MSVIYKSYEDLMEEAMELGEARGVDTRQGSVYYDAAAGHCLRMSQFYADLEITANLILLDTSTGEVLDELGSTEHSVTRQLAIAARYAFDFTGTEPDTGAVFFQDETYLHIVKENSVIYLEAEEPGAAANNLTPGEEVVPVDNIDGLDVATLGELLNSGVDEESDDDFRQRIREKIGLSAENGNKQHYKTWCEEVAGVGRAKIYPLWNGDCTCKGVIISKEGLPPSSTVVDNVQSYVDPGGTGFGEGAANMGCKFTAVGAQAKNIIATCTVILNDGGTVETAKAQITAAITANFKDLALNTSDEDTVVVRFTSIGSLIFAQEAVLDYSNLKLNNGTSNIEVPDGYVPVLEEVVVNVATN